MTLSNNNLEVHFPVPEAEVKYYPNFLQVDRADSFFHLFLNSTNWQQDHIKIFGKTYQQPRLTALYGEEGKTYGYSGIKMNTIPFTSELRALKERIEQQTGSTFNIVLLNLYRDGRDSNGWHSDDEPELGKNPTIASISLGQPRYFHLKHKFNKKLKYKLLLGHGSLLIMAGDTQHNWQHQLPKTSRLCTARINLTFRNVI